MGSSTGHHLNMIPPHDDYVLYPEAPATYSPQHFDYSAIQAFDMESQGQAGYSRTFQDFPASSGYNSATMYADASQEMYPLESPELGRVPSNFSTASIPSATSSAMGSPYSGNGQTVPAPEWASHRLGLNPGIVNYDNFGSNEYGFMAPGMEEFDLNFNATAAKSNSFVDPSLIHAQYASRTPVAMQNNDTQVYQQQLYPESPALSQLSHMSRNSPRPVKAGSQSPYMSSQYQAYPFQTRRPSVTSHQSYTSESFSSDESKEKGRCTYPDCGKVFKDLKAHMLTHQNERPEKCPIQTCDYHIKGFARKYDKNRHTLTHYKGTMVCGFCPGSGSAAEKSFNRADVFKRHLTSVHAVEQTPPNSRKKSSSSTNSGKQLSGYAPDATGKCSTCSQTFTNAQDFYEHLDDCVLRIVQQEEPSEAINARRLAEVEQDSAVHDTLRANALPITTSTVYSADEDDEDDMENDSDDDFSPRGSKSSRKTKRQNPNGVQKSRGLTHSKGGVTLSSKGRKKRKDYPSSWGCPINQMKMKKRVMCVFDGQRRLWKDDMMLDTDYEVRMKLQGDDRAYVTDLDVQTMRRAEGFHGATNEEKGPWISDDLADVDLETLMEVKRD
ncbi:Transcription factor Sp2 [Phlyctema vagabunda]|uniref:Transcription factor Sp2 n=1 Tax=Phlyctema vagabunda TaxID=108571 RepID=A0ABR4PY50_9HELO